ncbi:glycosyl hydrolase family 81 protein [Wolffia australiana]
MMEGIPFPPARSSVLQDPSAFFAPHLLSSPLPTNSFFQNLVLNSGDQPEYIHPYLIRSSGSALTLCYPSRFVSPLFVSQVFTPDLTISAAPGGAAAARHVVSSFDALSVTLDLPPSLRFFLVRGSPFVTCSAANAAAISISTAHAVVSFSSSADRTRHVVGLNRGQTFLCYSSFPLPLVQISAAELRAGGFSGVLRVAYLPSAASEPLLDRFSGRYAVSGGARFAAPFALEYRWETVGQGELLLLAHPLHVKLLRGGGAAVEALRYQSIDGELVGVVGNRWLLQAEPIPVTFHSIGGVAEAGREEIAAALARDVGALGPVATASSYFFGKAVARAARLAVIAEEVGRHDLVEPVRAFLRRELGPWLRGNLRYEALWGGLVSERGLVDPGVDFGFGVYNDHHYHLGYLLYAMAVLAKLDPGWGKKHEAEGYAMAADFVSFSEREGRAAFPRLRCFDLWKLHSWAGGLTEFADGRNQESTSEAVHAYYAAALLGMSYGDVELAAAAATLAALEAAAAATWWHAGEGVYEEEFCRENRVVGVAWANKRDGGLWFAPPERRECRLGIQVLPLVPVTEALFRDVRFARELVRWAQAAQSWAATEDAWRGFAYALEGLFDAEAALEKTRRLTRFDDGNSLSNMLWWLHSRPRAVRPVLRL